MFAISLSVVLTCVSICGLHTPLGESRFVESRSLLLKMNINSRLKGAVDRELGGEYIRFVSQFSKILNFDECCRTTIFILRFFIRPVQSVVNSPAQLSGRGFPRIFHMKLVLSQHHVFWYSKMEAGPCNLKICNFEF